MYHVNNFLDSLSINQNAYAVTTMKKDIFVKSNNKKYKLVLRDLYNKYYTFITQSSLDLVQNKNRFNLFLIERWWGGMSLFYKYIFSSTDRVTE